ncbi:MAG: phospho-N-acetylmuramoyl-pentapeptide-transferase [Oscillospiraceae bacterium]|nr:phospho-N-acetylmuramoyl-pentapeptide-transferase [Oscillospiraceae bacterium]
MILEMLLGLLVSFVVTAAFGRFLIPKLREMKAGQSIREDGPVWHMAKQGTPTMGGLMFIVGIGAALFTVGFPALLDGRWGHVIVFGFALIYAAIGFLDDYEKLKKKQNLGLTASQKFLLQLVVAIVLVLVLRLSGFLTPSLHIPFFMDRPPLQLPEIVYFIFAAFVIVGTVNAVNITDGVDGLASGVSLPVAICFGALALHWGVLYAELGLFAGALAGGLIGFLIYNFNPAKVFMGDTGSLFLGGAICGIAFAMNVPLVLIPVGAVYIAETLSDVIQVVYYKATGGKRFFRMAPLHHHFEMGGLTGRGKKWKERKVFTVFTLVSAVFAVIAYLSVYLRYGA